MSEPRGPLFLGRGSYRRRRMADAARLLPLLGVVLMGVPLLWRHDGSAEAPATSQAIIYLFGAICLLVVLCRVITRRLAVGTEDDSEGTGGDDFGTGDRLGDPANAGLAAPLRSVDMPNETCGSGGAAP
jgi:hypothetical protein